MKKHLLLITSLILLCASIFGIVVSADTELTVKVGMYENSPKLFTDDKGNVSGFWPDIIEYIASEEGWKIEYIHGTWPESLNRLETNEIDIMPDVAYTEERSKIFNFSNETVLASWSIVYTREGTDIEDITDLEGKNIAVLKGSVNVEGSGGIKELISSFDLNPTITEVESYTRVFELIHSGEADAGVTNNNFGNENEHNYDVIRTSIIFQPARIYFAFPKESSSVTHLIERVDHHLIELKKGPHSIYYQSLEKWLAIEPGEAAGIPVWIIWILVGIGGLAILFAVGNFILRSQVRSRTKELVKEITEHRQADESLRESEKRFRDIFETTLEAILITDAEGKIASANPASAKMFMYNDVNELIGREITEFYFHPEERQDWMSKAKLMGYAENVELAIKKRDGTLGYVLANINLLRDKDGNVAGTEAFFSDITERKLAEKELKESEEYYRKLIDISPHAILVHIDQKIIFMNPAGLELMGAHKSSEIIGKSIFDFIHTDYLEVLKGRQELLKKGEEPPRNEYVKVFRLDRSVVDTELTTVHVIYQGKSAIMVTVRDITDRLKAEKALQEAYNQLEDKVIQRTEELEKANLKLQELDQLKSMFIASMSHELRTPLNSIIGFTGIILQGISGKITEDQRKELTMVKNSANHLLALINDIIDVSKIETGKTELSIEEFNLADLMQEVMGSFKVAIDEKHLKLSLEMPERLIIKGDQLRIKQVIMNLLSNAVKFTDSGEIGIKVKRKDEEVVVSVTDTGRGIKKENMERLFKQFSRIYIKGRPAIEGTGLGLYLCKKIVDLLGGNIKAESEFGKGSMFTFTFPLEYKEVKV